MGHPGETGLQDAGTTMSQSGKHHADDQAQEAERSVEAEAAAAESATDAGGDESLPDPDQLTRKQLKTVRLVYGDTDATQGDSADRLGVTRATVSRRLNDVPSFEWSDRAAATATLLDGTECHGGSAGDDTPTDDHQSGNATPAGPGARGSDE